MADMTYRIHITATDNETGLEVPVLIEEEHPEGFTGFMLLADTGKSGLFVAQHVSKHEIGVILASNHEALHFVRDCTLMGTVMNAMCKSHEECEDDGSE